MQIGAGGSIFGHPSLALTGFGSNVYISSGYKRTGVGEVALMEIDTGAFNFKTAASGAADSAISWTEAMRILNNGNVGIGTVAPQVKLSLRNDSANTDWLADSNTLLSIENFNTTPNNFATIFFRGAVSGDQYSYGAGIGANFQRTQGSADLFFETRNQLGVLDKRMTILGNGNVGIGTTVPDVKTHIYNASDRTDLRVESAGGDGKFASIQVKGGGSNAWWTIVTNSSVIGGAVDNLAFYKESGTIGTKMVIQNNGNVGIGTTTPGNILSIQQTSATDPVADAWTVYSSGRWKEHRVPIINALETINELNPVYFDWKAEYGGAHDLGFIAEEVGLIVPEIVAWEDNGIDAKSIDYARLSTIAIAGVKEMNLNLSAITGTIVPTAGSQEEIFANNFFANIFTRVGAWLGDAENGIEKIFVREVNTGTLCIFDATGAKTCINKAQLDDLLVSVGFSSPLGEGAGGGDDGDIPPSVDDNLAKAKTDANALTVENYTSESWGIFTTALATAQELPEENDGEKIIKTTALNDAVAGLEILVIEEVVTDLTAYDVVVDAKTETDYTLESWTTYMDIVNANVVTIVNSQTEVDTATSNITAAQVSLISK